MSLNVSSSHSVASVKSSTTRNNDDGSQISNLEHPLSSLPRKVRPINKKTLKTLKLSAIEQEQILRSNANSRPAYKKDLKSVSDDYIYSGVVSI